MPKPSPRSSEVGKQLRGEALVRKVLDVTVDEMMRADVGALSVESIASAAGVNKTTVYRRWGTLEALVREAGERLLATLSPPRDTGTFRDDLLHYYRGIRELLIAVRLRTTIFRLPTGAPVELEKIRLTFEQQKRDEFIAICERAVARDEVTAGFDVELLGNVLAGAVMQLTFLTPGGCDDAKLAQIVDLVLPGIPGWKPLLRGPDRKRTLRR